MTASTSRKSRVLNISVPPDMFVAIESTAHAEQRTKSELMREAFRSYQFARRWRVVRQLGADTAVRFGIESDEALEAFLG